MDAEIIRSAICSIHDNSLSVKLTERVREAVGAAESIFLAVMYSIRFGVSAILAGPMFSKCSDVLAWVYLLT